MSDPVVRSNASVPRIELRAAFGANSRLIKAFENLFEDVAAILPDAAGSNTAAISVAQDSADTAQALANLVAGIAAAAFGLGMDAALDPGIGPLQAEISLLRSRIDALEQGTTP